MPPLPFRDGETLSLPIDVVQRERRDLTTPQAVDDQQQQNGVVPLPARRATVDAGEHPLYLGPGDRPGDGGQPIRLRPVDRVGQITPQDALAVRVAQEHPQDAAALPHRRLGQPQASALGHERAQQLRGQFADGRADPDEIDLEAVQVVAIRLDRRRAKSPLVDQVLEEPGNRCGERQRSAAPTRRFEAGQHDREHLLDQDPDILGQGRACHAITTDTSALGNPLSNEPLDVVRQIHHRGGAAGTGELPESDQRRDTVGHVPRAIPVLGHPVDVALDLRSDPRRPDAIRRGRLDEVLLQHGQLPLCE